MHRFKAIDILRATAVILILGRHMAPCPVAEGYALSIVSEIWQMGGWIGVDLFFVLSGFLVSGLIFREYQARRNVDLIRFLTRRGLKIYPAFWVLILTTMAVLFVQGESVESSRVLAELFFVQNYTPGLWNHTWSLAVEEHFYFALGILLWVLNRRPIRGTPFALLPTLFVVVAGACLILRVLAVNLTPFNFYTQFFPSHLRMDSLFFGVLISYEYHFRNEAFMGWANRWKRLFLPLGLALMAPAFIFPIESNRFMLVSGFVFLYLGSGLVLIASLCTSPGRGLLGRCLAYVGSHSYSIYLWHMPVAFWGCGLAARVLGEHWNWYWYALVYFLGSILAGIGMAAVVEFPVIRLRDRFFPSRSQALGAPNFGVALCPEHQAAPGLYGSHAFRPSHDTQTQGRAKSEAARGIAETGAVMTMLSTAAVDDRFDTAPPIET